MSTFENPTEVNQNAPKKSALTQDLSFLLARSNALSLAAGNNALRAFNLKVRSYAVLSLACDSTQATQREIAEFLKLDPSQVVALIDDLENRGLVERRTDTRDRRSKVVAATTHGRHFYREAKNAISAVEKGPFSALSAQEREQLSALLRRIALPDENGYIT